MTSPSPGGLATSLNHKGALFKRHTARRFSLPNRDSLGRFRLHQFFQRGRRRLPINQNLHVHRNRRRCDKLGHGPRSKG